MIERDGPVGSRASNGQPYFTLTHAGRKLEGESYPFVVLRAKDNQQLAVEAALGLFDDHLTREKDANRGMALEWRVRPMVSFRGECDGIAIAVRARLAFVDAIAEAA